MSKTITEWVFAAYEHAKNKGFHDGDDSSTQKEKVASWLMNLHSEVSELWEAFRENRLDEPCDKTVKMIGGRRLTCLEEEMADIAIRLFDTAWALGVDLEAAIEAKHAFNKTRPRLHGGKLA